MRLAVLLLLLAAAPPRRTQGPCDGAPPAAPVAYTLTPVVSDGRLTHLAVELRFCGDADGSTRLVMPDAGGAAAPPWSAPVVEGGAALARDGERAWRLAHRPGAALVVRYEIRPAGGAAADTAAEPGAAFDKSRPVVRPGWFFFHGEGVFAEPDGRDGGPARFAWGRLPAGWRVASDLDHVADGHPARWRAATVTDVQESVALGAPDLEVETRRVGGAAVRVARRGRWAFPAAALADTVAAVTRALHDYWADPVRPFFVAAAPLVPDAGGGHSIHGTGRGDAFSLAATTNADLPAQRRLLAHELAHAWVPTALGGYAARDEAREYWFTEGLADFVAARALLRAGLWTPERFAADLDSALYRTATSPARALPNAEAAARHWRDPDVRQLAYDRGHLLGHLVDHQARAASGGRAGLDDVLRAQRRAAARDARRGVRVSAAARFPAAVRARTGVDVRGVLARHVERGEPVWLPEALFGACARVERVTGPVFDRGFDAAATRAAGGVATGVDSAGPAWAAGLRDGLRLVRREAGVVGDPAVRYALRVSDGAREWTLSYLPASARHVAWQRVALAPPRDAAARAACAARLHGG